MKTYFKLCIIALSVVIMTQLFIRFFFSRPSVSPNLEFIPKRFIEMLINKEIEAIYNEFIKDTPISMDEFKLKMNEFYKVFGIPKSFNFHRSYFGGDAYIIVYYIIFNNKEMYKITFLFSFEKGTKLITRKELDTIQIRQKGNEKESKVFTIFIHKKYGRIQFDD